MQVHCGNSNEEKGGRRRIEVLKQNKCILKLKWILQRLYKVVGKNLLYIFKNYQLHTNQNYYHKLYEEKQQFVKITVIVF